jgi:hypothetical protein
MTMEGARKFTVMWLGIISVFVLAKFGPVWGGIFDTAQPMIAVGLASVIYFLYNYLQKTSADTFVPENWLAGKRTIIGFIMAIVAPLMASASSELKDATSQTITLIVEAGIPIAFMVFQSLSDKKLAAKPASSISTSSGSPQITAPVPVPIVPLPMTSPLAEAAAPVIIPSIKDRIKIARQTYGTWEGTKQLMLGTFKEAFESALRRLLRLNPNLKTLDAARAAILEIVGVQLDDKACEAIGQIPGFLGAVGANADIKIIGDLLDAIDRTPELSYMKAAFIKIATRYAVKNILDEVVLRIQAGQGDESSKRALEEFGLTRWQVDKSQWSGGNLQIWYSTTNQKDSYGFRQFDQYMLAGVDNNTMEDLK